MPDDASATTREIPPESAPGPDPPWAAAQVESMLRIAFDAAEGMGEDGPLPDDVQAQIRAVGEMDESDLTDGDEEEEADGEEEAETP